MVCVGCGEARTASFVRIFTAANDALRSSAHPMSSIYFVANNQGNNMINKQVFSTVYLDPILYSHTTYEYAKFNEK